MAEGPTDPRDKEAWRDQYERSGSLGTLYGEAAHGGSNSALGRLSARYETGGRGPGTISSGVGDPGGVSYGSYQLATNRGRPQEFLQANGRAWAAEFGGSAPATPGFNAAWTAVAKRDPDRFHQAQHEFIRATHYEPQVARVMRDTGADVCGRSRALQDVVWSTAVQHGPGTDAVVTAIRNLARAGGDAQSDEPLIHEIYAERRRRIAANRRLGPKVKASVAARYDAEERDALGMLREESALGPANP